MDRGGEEARDSRVASLLLRVSLVPSLGRTLPDCMSMAVTQGLVIAELARTFHIPELSLATFKGFAYFVVPFVLLMYVLEHRSGADMSRYRSRAFLHDIVYALFYRTGFYAMFVFSAVAAALGPALEFLNLGLLRNASFPVAVVVFWILGDFMLYWIHRLQHSSRILWAFHSVHHVPSELTTLTQFRRHPLDWILGDFALFVVFVVFLGLAPGFWLPLYILMKTLQALQHAELHWRFGWLHSIVVSPVFHSLHHSIDERYHHSNFGLMFSVWDVIFGTAVQDQNRPDRYGVSGLAITESLVQQFITPFRLLAGRVGRRSIADTAHGNATGEIPDCPRGNTD